MPNLESPIFFNGQIKNMEEYSPPLKGRLKEGILLLNFNERTTKPHPTVMRNIQEYLARGKLQVYPEYGDLDVTVGNYAGVASGQVITTNGSDQGIDIIYRGIVGKEDKVLLPVPTFAMLEQSAHVQGAQIISPRYKGTDLQFPFEEVMDSISSDIKLVVICNPNNPTGTAVSKEQSEAIIKKAAGVGVAVMVDEAYHEFAPPELTVVGLVGEYDNLFVTRSLSKIMGVSALRAGYVISQEQNIAELRKIRGPYDVNMIASAAMMALREPEVVEDMKKYTREVMEVSKPMVEAFYRENGIEFFPSAAGFHLLQEPPGFIAFLEEKKILVTKRPEPKGTVRVSIGTEEDTRKYIEAFSEFLKSRTTS